MKVNFITPTKLSLLDVISMGDSAKRGDEKTIGQFNSGLKFSIALLLRLEVDISIKVGGEYISHETYEEPTTEVYRFGTYVHECPNTGKTKELIEVLCERIPHGGSAMNQHDMREPSERENWEVKTGFAKGLGYNWSDWMIIRELWSNMLDEGGCVNEDFNYYVGEEELEGTIITLEFSEENPFYTLWKNKHLYINQEEPLFILSSSVSALKNEEKYLRIYKQNILVYEDKDRYSKFAWNIGFGELDETRILRDVSVVEQRIAESILSTGNEEFLREIINNNFATQEKEFLYNPSTYYGASDLINKIATELYEQYEEVKSYDWIISKIRSRKDCAIGGKKITTIQDSLWGYSKEVTVESKPQAIQEDIEIIDDEVVDAIHPLQKEIDKYYNFKLDVEVKTARLKGSKVVKDGFEKCLIISEDFNVETDFTDFIVEYVDFKYSGNVVKNLAEFIIELIKK